MKCAGVVVLYNPGKDLIKNIKNYIDDIEVLYVVDNTPNTDHSDMFKDMKKVKYICNNKNLGVATGLNTGAENAIKDGCDWLLTMDQDSTFNNGDVKKMLEYINSLEKNEIVQQISGFDIKKLALVTPYHITLNRLAESKAITGIDRSIVVMTSGNIINLSIYKKLGGYKDWLFIDAVDFDYCLNIKKHKYEIVTLNYIKLKHNLGDITQCKFLGKTIFNLNYNHIRRYYIVRNRLYINKMYRKDFPWYCKIQLKLNFKDLLKIILFEENKWKKIKYTIKGYIDYYKGKKGSL
jgi:rhamnosyltransferase